MFKFLAIFSLMSTFGTYLANANEQDDNDITDILFAEKVATCKSKYDIQPVLKLSDRVLLELVMNDEARKHYGKKPLFSLQNDDLKGLDQKSKAQAEMLRDFAKEGKLAPVAAKYQNDSQALLCKAFAEGVLAGSVNGVLTDVKVRFSNAIVEALVKSLNGDSKNKKNKK